MLENWEKINLVDDSARRLLEIAEQFLVGTVEMEKVERAKGIFSTMVEDLMDNGEEYFMAAYAGFSCISAVNAVLYDVNIDMLGQSEIEIDPDYWTSSFYACLSYCKGAIWENEIGDDLKRREFWEWFLNDSIPALWETSEFKCYAVPQ